MRCKRSPGLLLLAIVAIGIVVTPVLAANVHFTKGPTFTDNGVTLTATGTIAGIGNQDFTIEFTVVGEGTVLCVNPGGKVVPGQNKIPFKQIISEKVSASSIKNGSYSFSLITTSPTQPTPKQAGCPNGNWRAAIDDEVFFTATITVIQNGKTVLTQSFNF